MNYDTWKTMIECEETEEMRRIRFAEQMAAYEEQFERDRIDGGAENE